MTFDGPARPASFFEFNAQHAAAASSGALSPGWRLASTTHVWTVRAQNFAVGVSWLSTGETLSQTGIPDQIALLVSDSCSIIVASNSTASLDVAGPAFVVVPAGDSIVTGKEPGFVTRLCTARANELISEARNQSAYVSLEPAVSALPATPPQARREGIRVYNMADVPGNPGRFGRVLRTDSLMVDWPKPTTGPRDVNQLTVHGQARFEKVSVTLAGDFVHHVRSPWTERLAEWRADDHVLVTSPSVTIIPPGNIHTAREVGDGPHQLIEVFAPPRQDLVDSGRVINQSDYEK